MKITIASIIVAIILLAIFLLSGGIYRTETVQVGIVHRTNILTGDISLCVLDEGCRKFSQNKNYENNSNCKDIKSDDLAIYPLSYFRKKYPEYNDLKDKELATALYRRYSEKSGLNISMQSFFEVIGYQQ